MKPTTYTINFKSVQDRTIPAFVWDNGNYDNTVLILAGQHGCEAESVEIVGYHFLDELHVNPPTKNNVVVIPCLNPDGYELYMKYTEDGNNVDIPTSQITECRKNATGVDLNANLPNETWEFRAPSPNFPNEYPYTGKTPASEPETKALIATMNMFKPRFVVSVHARNNFYDPSDEKLAKFSPLIDYDGPAEKAAIEIGKLSGYPVKTLGAGKNGFGRWSGVERNVPTITYEFQKTPKNTSVAKWVEKDAHKHIAALKFACGLDFASSAGAYDPYDLGMPNYNFGKER